MYPLLSRALELQQVAHDLLYLGVDGSPIYSDHFCRLNKEVLAQSDALFPLRSTDIEEEANLCLALLMGYSSTIYGCGGKEEKIQIILDRICGILDKVPASLLKVRLLTYCYGEVYEESMLQEACAIIDGWDKEALTSEQVEIVEVLRGMGESSCEFKVFQEVCVGCGEQDK